MRQSITRKVEPVAAGVRIHGVVAAFERAWSLFPADAETRVTADVWMDDLTGEQFVTVSGDVKEVDE